MKPENANGAADVLGGPGGSDFDDLSNVDRFLVIPERITFLDTKIALRRFDAISVGDGAPFPSGVSVGVRRGDRITFTVHRPRVRQVGWGRWGTIWRCEDLRSAKHSDQSSHTVSATRAR